MITFLMVVGIVAAYAVIGGFVAAVSMPFYERRDVVDYEFAGFLSGFFWPVVIPVLIGIGLGTKSHSLSKVSRAERKQAQEIVEAKHQAELAKIRRLEAAELDRQLAAAERKAR